MKANFIVQTLISIFLIAAVLLFISTGLMGYVFQKNYRNILAIYNSQVGLEIKIIKYEQHWLTSDVELEVAIKNPLFRKVKIGQNKKSVALPLQFKVLQKIIHGPLVWNTKLRRFDSYMAKVYSVVMPEKQEYNIAASSPTRALLNMSGIINWNHTYISNLQTAEINLIYGKSFLLFLEKLNGQLFIDMQSAIVQGDVEFGKLTVDSDEQSISVPKLEWKFSNLQNAQNIWIGEHWVSFPELYVSKESHTAVMNIKGLQFHSQSLLQHNKLILRKTLNIAEVNSPIWKTGPFTLAISADNINAENYVANLPRFRDEFYQTPFFEALKVALPNLLMHVVNNDTSFKVDKLEAKFPSGFFEVHSALSWHEKPKNFLAFALGTSLDTQIRVSKNVVDELIPVIANYAYKTPTKPVKDAFPQAVAKDIVFLKLLAANNKIDSEVSHKLAMKLHNLDIVGYEQSLQLEMQEGKISQNGYSILSDNLQKLKNMSLTVEQKRERLSNDLKLLLDKILANGYVNLENNTYQSEITLQQGVIKANNKVVN